MSMKVAPDAKRSDSSRQKLDDSDISITRDLEPRTAQSKVSAGKQNQQNYQNN